jgi:fermentation-respiration switch protein FrsA (DUF1100 family)
LVTGVAVAVVSIYVAALLTLFFAQRRFIYFPPDTGGAAADFGLPGARTVTVTTSDGQTIAAWFQAGRSDKPLYLFFHGNGGSLVNKAAWFAEVVADGSGFLAIDYRGYGSSTGTPSEEGLLRDGEAAFVEAQQLGHGRQPIVVVGESLGTAVAVSVAANHPVKALVLDSAFSAASDIAAAKYWMFPVRMLMRDPFRSIDRIGDVKAPILFLHAAGDAVVPIAFARKLFDKAVTAKTFIEVPGDGHTVLWRKKVLADTKAWVTNLPVSAK